VSRKKSSSVSILLADDHDVVRKGVSAMLETQQGWHVCAEAASGKEAVRLAAELRPRIAVIDLEMPELGGLQATRRITKETPETEVLIFTMHDSELLMREVLFAGARGFVLKAEGGHKLIEGIATVIDHRPYFSGHASESLLKSFLNLYRGIDERRALTHRETEIVQLLAMGKSNKEAAVALGISVKTIETHRAAIMRKLRLRSTADLVRYAVREHIIKA